MQRIGCRERLRRRRQRAKIQRVYAKISGSEGDRGRARKIQSPSREVGRRRRRDGQHASTVGGEDRLTLKTIPAPKNSPIRSPTKTTVAKTNLQVVLAKSQRWRTVGRSGCGGSTPKVWLIGAQPHSDDDDSTSAGQGKLSRANSNGHQRWRDGDGCWRRTGCRK